MRRMKILLAGIVMIMGSCKKSDNALDKSQVIYCDDARYEVLNIDVEYNWPNTDTLSVTFHTGQYSLNDSTLNKCTCGHCPILLDHTDTTMTGISYRDFSIPWMDSLWGSDPSLPNIGQTVDREGHFVGYFEYLP